MENVIYSNITATAVDLAPVKVSRIIAETFGVNNIEGYNVLKQIIGDGYPGPISELQFETIQIGFVGLKYGERKVVSQEKALYGDYPVDSERLDMAKNWYNKQTPEVQSFVDVLIRSGSQDIKPNDKYDVHLIREDTLWGVEDDNGSVPTNWAKPEDAIKEWEYFARLNSEREEGRKFFLNSLSKTQIDAIVVKLISEIKKFSNE